MELNINQLPTLPTYVGTITDTEVKNKSLNTIKVWMHYSLPEIRSNYPTLFGPSDVEFICSPRSLEKNFLEGHRKLTNNLPEWNNQGKNGTSSTQEQAEKYAKFKNERSKTRKAKRGEKYVLYDKSLILNYDKGFDGKLKKKYLPLIYIFTVNDIIKYVGKWDGASGIDGCIRFYLNAGRDDSGEGRFRINGVMRELLKQ